MVDVILREETCWIGELIIIIFVTKVFEWSETMEVATVNTLDQRYVLCADYDRDMVLIEVLRRYREDNETANIMIFTNTKKYVLRMNEFVVQ